MPASPEQLLALLEAPHWKAAGSTSVRPEGPTARRTEGKAPVNVTVLDHIAKGTKTLAAADRLAAQGTSLALRKAEALRKAQAIKTQALMGETNSVRSVTCPYCGTYGLLLHQGRAVCVNRHCAAAGRQRSWTLVDLMMARPVQPKGIRRSVKPPRDVMDIPRLVQFFKTSGYPVSASTVSRIVKTYDLPRWPDPLKERTVFLYSLSDVLTAHALHALKGNPSDCAAAAEKPACSGLADLFFGVSDQQMNQDRLEQAKALCEGCPFREPCLDVALLGGDRQHGIQAGLIPGERRDLNAARNKTN
ncbi:WhiB family transcriptional regulator [Streptomyces angustmyceticus]|uniref:WhiB family transcriptional regulator n=1 Tax=Streptomyces angustmyceticus TaxID=285578 RepID=UPI00344D29AD